MEQIRRNSWIVAMAIVAMVSTANAATFWNNTLIDGDINNAANWSAGLPSDAGTLGIIVSTTPLTINQIFNNGGDNRSEFMIVGAAGLTVATGGNIDYLGDGLYGWNGAPGTATINHTGGTLTQDGGGAGMLIGHTDVASYNISGGNIVVQGSAPTLTIDFNDTGAGDPDADGSSMTISGTGQVDVETGVGLVINSGGTLTVLGGGLLVWHDRLVSEAVFAGTVNATITQVGNDVHFTALSVVPAPAALPAGLALIGLVAMRRRR